MALGNPTVDYMSLDIEGAELPVLKTVPWDKVTITIVFSIYLLLLQVFFSRRNNKYSFKYVKRQLLYIKMWLWKLMENLSSKRFQMGYQILGGLKFASASQKAKCWSQV